MSYLSHPSAGISRVALGGAWMHWDQGFLKHLQGLDSSVRRGMDSADLVL